MHVSMMHISVMRLKFCYGRTNKPILGVGCSMHVFRMQVSMMNLCMIYVFMIHVCVIHVCMMHVWPLILMHVCMMHISMIHDPDYDGYIDDS